jgi:hypothetical protein
MPVLGRIPWRIAAALGVLAVLVASYALRFRQVAPAQQVAAPEPARAGKQVRKTAELQPGPEVEPREEEPEADEGDPGESMDGSSASSILRDRQRFDESGSILGHIWDGRNGLPMEGETVQIVARPISQGGSPSRAIFHERVETDRKGTFQSVDVPPQTWQVELVRGAHLESWIPLGEVIVRPALQSLLEVEFRCGERALSGSLPFDLTGAQLPAKSPSDAKLQLELELLDSTGRLVRRAQAFTRLQPLPKAMDPTAAAWEEPEEPEGSEPHRDGAFRFEDLEPLVYTLRAILNRDRDLKADIPVDLREEDVELTRTLAIQDFLPE